MSVLQLEKGASTIWNPRPRSLFEFLTLLAGHLQHHAQQVRVRDLQHLDDGHGAVLHDQVEAVVPPLLETAGCR